MENQHKKISGYRDLTQAEIDLMNRIKAFGPELQTIIADVMEHLVLQDGTDDTKERERLDAADPYRWLEIGREHLQQGLMALTRAVAQPTFF
jgi:hypothetical protein